MLVRAAALRLRRKVAAAGLTASSLRHPLPLPLRKQHLLRWQAPRQQRLERTPLLASAAWCRWISPLTLLQAAASASSSCRAPSRWTLCCDRRGLSVPIRACSRSCGRTASSPRSRWGPASISSCGEPHSGPDHSVLTAVALVLPACLTATTRWSSGRTRRSAATTRASIYSSR